MAEKPRPKGPGGKGIQAPSSLPLEADSGQARKRSASDLFWVNDKGEYCFGTACFQMRIKPGSEEVRVIVDRNECGKDAQQVVDVLFAEVVKGAPTVYETKSKVKES